MKHRDIDHILGYADLHNHLYGCLSGEKLYQIGKDNPSPRWEIFVKNYEEVFGKKILPEKFFQEYNSLEKFEKLYYFDHRGPFPEFQAKFNLIIALVKFTPSEMEDVAKQVTIDHANQGVEYGEYRIMFARDETRSVFEERIHSACKGAVLGEEEARKQGKEISSRIAYSLLRSGNFWEQYEWIRELMVKDSLVGKYLVGLDFCYIEEGYPPKEKKDFFQQVLLDNKAAPDYALSILYHVGESYQDKTPFSASRWVWESARYGVHRLGHCIALGIRPEIFLGKNRKESYKEKRDQILFELEHYNDITKQGEYYSKAYLENQLKRIQNLSTGIFENGFFEWELEEKDIVYLRTFQDFCMQEISLTPAVIESCPSSNYYIGMIENPAEHPLPRFVRNGLSVTIASDDPGIFHTTIGEEYKKAKEMSISSEALEKIRKNSFSYTSEILSGRKSL